MSIPVEPGRQFSSWPHDCNPQKDTTICNQQCNQNTIYKTVVNLFSMFWWFTCIYIYMLRGILQLPWPTVVWETTKVCPWNFQTYQSKSVRIVDNECSCLFSWPIGSMYAIYGNMDPINIPPMLAYIAYMDPMGDGFPFVLFISPNSEVLVKMTRSPKRFEEIPGPWRFHHQRMAALVPWMANQKIGFSSAICWWSEGRYVNHIC